MTLAEPAARPRILEAAKIVETIAGLQQRIANQFPGSGLAQLCGDLQSVANETAGRADRLAQPYWGLRAPAFALVVAGVAAQLYFGVLIDWRGIILRAKPVEIAEGLDAIVNLAVLAAGGLWSVWTLERRWKRRRILANLYEFRSLAHIVDMHQLTKDPTDQISGLNEAQLARYLDYSSQMLALIAKLAALYAEHTQDQEVISSVNEIEELTSNLGRKTWQKIMILSRLAEQPR
jgi:hypothetical protein